MRARRRSGKMDRAGCLHHPTHAMSHSEQVAAAAAARVDYGLDAPGIVKTFAALGGSLLVTALALRIAGPLGARRLVSAASWMGFSFAATALLMIASSRFGKLRARDRLLDALDLTGHETVLDVGCGHGLLLVGAAKRLSTGRAIGIDLWLTRDQADNSAAAAL